MRRENDQKLRNKGEERMQTSSNVAKDDRKNSLDKSQN